MDHLLCFESIDCRVARQLIGLYHASNDDHLKHVVLHDQYLRIALVVLIGSRRIQRHLHDDRRGMYTLVIDKYFALYVTYLWNIECLLFFKIEIII